MSRLSTSMRMSTQSELLSGIAILSASLLMRAVAVASPIGFFLDVLGFFSVLFLVAGVGVVFVGLVHRASRVEDRAKSQREPMTAETSLATGAIIGVGIGSSVGAAYGGALSVAVGTAIGAAMGIAAATAWKRSQHRQP